MVRIEVKDIAPEQKDMRINLAWWRHHDSWTEERTAIAGTTQQYNVVYVLRDVK